MTSWVKGIRLHSHQTLCALSYIPSFLMGIPKLRAVSSAADSCNYCFCTDLQSLRPPVCLPESYPTDPQQEMKEVLNGDRCDQPHLAILGSQEERQEGLWCQWWRQMEEMWLLRVAPWEKCPRKSPIPICWSVWASSLSSELTWSFFFRSETRLDIWESLSVFTVFKECSPPFTITKLNSCIPKATFHCHCSPLKCSI